MRRESLLFDEIIAASQRAHDIASRHSVEEPVRLRNRIVHGYWSVDLDVIHSVALSDLPGFVEQVRSIASEMQP